MARWDPRDFLRGVGPGRVARTPRCRSPLKLVGVSPSRAPCPRCCSWSPWRPRRRRIGDSYTVARRGSAYRRAARSPRRTSGACGSCGAAPPVGAPRASTRRPRLRTVACSSVRTTGGCTPSASAALRCGRRRSAARCGPRRRSTARPSWSAWTTAGSKRVVSTGTAMVAQRQRCRHVVAVDRRWSRLHRDPRRGLLRAERADRPRRVEAADLVGLGRGRVPRRGRLRWIGSTTGLGVRRGHGPSPVGRERVGPRTVDPGRDPRQDLRRHRQGAADRARSANRSSDLVVGRRLARERLRAMCAGGRRRSHRRERRAHHDPDGRPAPRVHAKGGRRAWTGEMADYATSSPAYVHGMFVVGSFDHRLYAFGATHGAELWNSRVVLPRRLLQARDLRVARDQRRQDLHRGARRAPLRARSSLASGTARRRLRSTFRLGSATHRYPVAVSDRVGPRDRVARAVPRSVRSAVRGAGGMLGRATSGSRRCRRSS